MTETLITPHTQKHLPRRRRWLVPVVIGIMLLLAMASLAYLTLASTSITIEEAEVLCANADENKISIEEVRVRFGKPFRQSTGNSASSVWVFTRQSLNSIDLLNVVMIDGQPGEASSILALGRETVHGWNAWVFRWELLKYRLGLK